MPAAIVVQEPDVAARAQTAGAGAIEEYGGHLVVALPGIKRRSQRADHRRAEGVERLRAVEGEPTERALAADENLGHGQQSSTTGQDMRCPPGAEWVRLVDGHAPAPSTEWSLSSSRVAS